MPTLGPGSYVWGVNTPPDQQQPPGSQPVPDDKDWTWVLDDQCPDCGFDARDPSREDLAPLSREIGARWRAELSSVADPRLRPRPAVWSPLEYSCHVRDVLDLAVYRVQLMLDEDDPLFANWDQDETAISARYFAQDPTVVVDEVVDAAEAFASLLERVPEEGWERVGRRGDGALFTVESFSRYLLHDPAHHLNDVAGVRWD